MKYDVELYTKACEYAKLQHEGQTREDGSDYICHPFAVSQNVFGWQSKIVAVLHDTIEDTDATVVELRELFGTEVALSVCTLTKIEEESYEEYIEHIKKCNDKIAIAVKIADLKHNLSTIDNIKKEDRKIKLKTRYEKALKELTEIQDDQ